MLKVLITGEGKEIRKIWEEYLTSEGYKMINILNEVECTQQITDGCIVEEIGYQQDSSNDSSKQLVKRKERENESSTYYWGI